MSDPNLFTMSLAGSFATEAATPEGPALAAFTTNWWVAFLVSELVRLTSPPQVAAL